MGEMGEMGEMGTTGTWYGASRRADQTARPSRGDSAGDGARRRRGGLPLSAAG
ncbi:hypothetical protein BH23GEM9_BH23GEM9_17330 [soil metagenome]